eukprot:CAMPEP_0170572436 /NCGR_PEP_ID=MMETSP0224-20130122/2213_1 /TAXON_ID=285029 /ORGANISM="Togula jolla, Strain CCCM 725" /LENGTH=386 /DNA_ID=CAMNT_0010894921 /DNA_START=65 /DNA_END=1225 /DNA_ORIENTATION=+
MAIFLIVICSTLKSTVLRVFAVAWSIALIFLERQRRRIALSKQQRAIAESTRHQPMVISLEQPVVVGRRPASSTSSNPAPILRKASTASSRRGWSTVESHEVSFYPTVSCWAIESLQNLDVAKKAQIWWQPADFADFLKVRVAIGKAYREIAKRRGVPVGSCFPPDPSLRHESRRGLGLGRKRQRAKNRDAYIAAVLTEQRRQRDLAAEAAQSGNGKALSLEAGMEALRRAAVRYSEKDRRYAHDVAVQYYEEGGYAEEEESSAADSPGRVIRRDTQESTCSLPDLSNQVETPSSKVFSETLSDGMDTIGKFERTVSPAGYSAKGFGLTKEDLAKVGLGITGHKLTESQRRQTAGPLHWCDSEESDAGGSEVSDMSDVAGDSDADA